MDYEYSFIITRVPSDEEAALIARDIEKMLMVRYGIGMTILPEEI